MGFCAGSAEDRHQNEEEQRWRHASGEQKQKQIQKHPALWDKPSFINFYRYLSMSYTLNYIIFLTFPSVDETRVILQDRDHNVVGSDYINGNYVKVFIKRSHTNTRVSNILPLLSLLILHLCRIGCVKAVLQKSTLRVKAVSQQPSTISGKWCGRRRHGSSSWRRRRSRKDGSVLWIKKPVVLFHLDDNFKWSEK